MTGCMHNKSKSRKVYEGTDFKSRFIGRLVLVIFIVTLLEIL